MSTIAIQALLLIKTGKNVKEKQTSIRKIIMNEKNGRMRLLESGGHDWGHVLSVSKTLKENVFRNVHILVPLQGLWVLGLDKVSII